MKIVGRVKFFCNCGKEIWDGLSEQDKHYLTIEIAEATCIYANCMMELNRAASTRPSEPSAKEEQTK